MISDSLTRRPKQSPLDRIFKPAIRSGTAFILLAAFVAIVPQLIRGNSCGHDFDVHLVSWLDCLNAWHHGILYPHWASSPNYGAGEPRFVYYPPLTWMLGAALGAILPWNLAPVVLTFLILAGTGLATRALALEVLCDPPATLAGITAIFSGFALFTAYERSAFPEFAGGIWLPLIVLFVLRVRHPAGPLLRRAFDGSTVSLALALAAAWFSNLPVGVIAGYLLVGLALLWALVRKSWAPVLRAALATPLGLGIASIYWLPAALERHWVDISQATQDPSYNFENSWAFARHADPSLALHDSILRQASWIAISMIAVAFLGLLVAWRRGLLSASKSPVAGSPSLQTRAGSSMPRLWIPLAAIPVVVLFFLFPISRPLWYLLPELPYLQYPWRMLEAVEAPMAIFCAAALWPAARRARIAVLAGYSLFGIAATLCAATFFFQVGFPEDSADAVVSAQRAGAGFEGMYEYAPPGADQDQIAIGLPDACLVSDAFADLGQPDPGDPEANPIWSPAQGSCMQTFSAIGGLRTNPEHRRITGTATQSGTLVLRLLRFPAWAIHLNGQTLADLPRRDDGLIAVPVSQGPFDLRVDWTAAPDIILSRWVCSLSICALIALSLLERKKKELN